MQVMVRAEPFDPGAELARLTEGAGPGAGALVTFTGLVRNDGGLAAMEIEHYPGMTERAIRAVADQAITRWALLGGLILHRYGRLLPGEPIMMVATLAAHRAEAFASADFLMDYLKSRAPFWKKEIGEDGAAWVEAKAHDEAALARWDAPASPAQAVKAGS